MQKYSPEIHEFIRENVQGKSTRDLVKIVNEKFVTNFTESKMKSYKSNHKLRSYTPSGCSPGSPTKKYPREVKNFIKEHHIGVGPKEMTELLNKTFGTNYTRGQIKSYYGNHGISSGLNGYFKPGHIPANKGRKGVDGWKPTQFKKGHKPHNWVPVGSERVTPDGYIQVKIQEGKYQKNWKGKHIIVWEKKHGTVPSGYAVIFGDGDKRNFDIDNLILVSKKQLAILNRKGLIQNDAELTRTGVIITDIYQKVSERKGE